MKAAIAGVLVGACALLAAAGCSKATSTTGVFKPAGPSTAPTSSAGGGGVSPTATAAAANGYVMPPFGRNVHITMTSWLPRDAAQAAAVNADKDYLLAFLYAEYKAGQDQSWVTYTAPAMQPGISAALRAPDVSTESFIGTIRYFDMSVVPDPTAHGDLDVSSCFDNADSSNTDLRTGAVLPATGSADQHYLRLTDQLAKNPAGQWQVVGTFPAIEYPRAKECKP